MKKLLLVLLLCVSQLAAAKSVDVELKGPVTMASMWELKFKLRYHINSGDTVYLRIDSPGGVISAGEMFIAELKRLQKRGKVICDASGKVISMAMMIFINCKHRINTNPDAMMLHHNPLFGYTGYLNAPIMREFIRQLQEISEKADKHFLEVTKMDEDYMEYLRDTDKILTAKEMKLKAKCIFNFRKVRNKWRRVAGCQK